MSLHNPSKLHLIFCRNYVLTFTILNCLTDLKGISSIPSGMAGIPALCPVMFAVIAGTEKQGKGSGKRLVLKRQSATGQ